MIVNTRDGREGNLHTMVKNTRDKKLNANHGTTLVWINHNNNFEEIEERINRSCNI